MPSVGIVIGDGKREYPGNLTPYVTVTCIVAAMGGLIFGYDIGISGGVTTMESFQKKFFPSVYEKQRNNHESSKYCRFDSISLTLFTSSLYLAALCSCVVASYVTRKLVGKFRCFSEVFSFAPELFLTVLHRPFGCLSLAVCYSVSVSDSLIRGALNIGFQLSITIGILVANVLNFFFSQISGGYGWRLSLGGAVVPALIITVGSLILPDTPNSMIERGQFELAETKLRKIRGVDDVEDEISDLIAASEASKLVEHPWRNLLQRKYRPHLTMAILIPSFQQLTGINVIMFYAPVLFQTIGFGSNAALTSAVVTGLVNLGATVVSIYGVDTWGRRFLFFEGGFQMLLSQVAVAAAIGAKFGVDGNPGHLPKWYAIVVVLFICIYVAAFAWSWGPLGWLVPSEIFPLEIRSAAQSVTVSMNMIFTFVIAQVFLMMLCHMKFGLFIFFAFFVVVMSIFVYFFLPETRGVPIEEMNQVWRSHWYWSRFVDA
ncbi:unnamed protein product [Arabis nemorensis]|uniref:Major facilitator superfamily (MFS) profile domain-containing protein n=1 Tax=Arabis nemorensis TaxID=586526 RepID=A0A565CEY3_9BRAS|nr:unnamed protein product [Arabis nemorensis]